MKKRIIAMMLATLTLLTFSVQTSALVPEEQLVMPCWTNMNNVIIDMYFDDNNNTGNSSVTVTRVQGVTESIEATFTIYRKSGNNWIYVTETSGESTRSLYLEVEFDATPGTTYKAVADITAYSETSAESETLEYQKTF